MPIKTRPATTDDLDWVVNELRTFDRYFGARRSLFPDESYARQVLHEFTAHPDILFQLAIAENWPFPHGERHTARIGFIVGAVTPHVLNPARRWLHELLWWVIEPMRGSKAAYLLLNDFIDFGKGRGRADVIVVTSNVRAGHASLSHESLATRGFLLRECHYTMEVT